MKLPNCSVMVNCSGGWRPGGTRGLIWRLPVRSPHQEVSQRGTWIRRAGAARKGVISLASVRVQAGRNRSHVLPFTCDWLWRRGLTGSTSQPRLSVRCQSWVGEVFPRGGDDTDREYLREAWSDRV
ncbi:hypothetical protein DPEC_G00304450 [Dallia pectoralis]|uniref:Uncharacterized protein n=1 Tax=Dallia pectoralis TaxID=75939 RepID=A0ACC2FDK7_DALPE|nr:hypothetical protein DPEC_G00304450 [Dallia pectoralis]